MSYISAEDVLPKELIETIQQYVNGKAIYIPSLCVRTALQDGIAAVDADCFIMHSLLIMRP